MARKVSRESKSNFDLILIDLAMPEFSGSDVIQTLKDDGVLESNNVVIFTASSDRSLLEENKRSIQKTLLFRRLTSIDAEIPSSCDENSTTYNH